MLEEKHKNSTKNKIKRADDKGQPASQVTCVKETNQNSQAILSPQISLSAEEIYFNSSPAPGYSDRVVSASY